MNVTLFIQLLDLACGVAVVAAYITLWRRELVAIVRAIALQGWALAIVALLLAINNREYELALIATIIALVKGIAIPTLLTRVIKNSNDSREVKPLLNVPSSLISSALLTLLAYVITHPLIEPLASPSTKPLPIALAIVFVGFLVLIGRQKAVTQIVGFVMIDNGISLSALLATNGVPLIVEMGVALDVLLAVIILRILVTRMTFHLGAMDIDELRELRD